MLAKDVAGRCLAPSGAVAAIGAFDGLHLGHQALLSQVAARAREVGLTPMVVSFEPLPRAYFSPEPLPRIGSVRQKLAGFRDAGLEEILLLRFQQELAETSAEDFVREVLAGRCGVRELWVGEGFRFGHRRSGDVDLLRRMGADLGFSVQVLDPVEVAGERVSSSRIRRALETNDFDVAARLLGRPFAISGHVAYGRGLGRKLGYPTANVHLGNRVSPIAGIFAVRIGMESCGGMWPGVASLGTRPTVAGTEPLLEAHLFDFEGDLYGRRIEVGFVAKLRDEQHFEDIDAMVVRMHEDARMARNLLDLPQAEPVGAAMDTDQQ